MFGKSKPCKKCPDLVKGKCVHNYIMPKTGYCKKSPLHPKAPVIL